MVLLGMILICIPVNFANYWSTPQTVRLAFVHRLPAPELTSFQPASLQRVSQSATIRLPSFYPSTQLASFLPAPAPSRLASCLIPTLKTSSSHLSCGLCLPFSGAIMILEPTKAISSSSLFQKPPIFQRNYSLAPGHSAEVSYFSILQHQNHQPEVSCPTAPQLLYRCQCAFPDLSKYSNFVGTMLS